MAYPYLSYVTSRCCYGLPYFKPYNGEEDGDARVEDEESNSLMNRGSKSQTFTTADGKEFKKRSKKKKKSALNDEAVKSEPLAQLGFGIVAYTGMLYYMIWAMAFFTLILVPTFMFYGRGDAYAGLNAANLQYAPRTIGALGYSSYECQSIPQNIEAFTFYCTYGTIGEVTYTGVNPDNAHGSCQWNKNNGLCPVSAAFNATMAAARGSASYQVDISKDSLFDTTVDASCTAADTYVYAQFQCVMDENTQHLKYN